MFRVFDDRNNETLFESEDRMKCTLFMDGSFNEDDEDWGHIWLEEN